MADIMVDIMTPAGTGPSKQALKQQADKQRIVRLFRGAYIDAEEYTALDTAGRYRAQARAFLATHPKLQAWGLTAAALEGAPVLSGAPLHFSGNRSNAKSMQKGCVFHETLPAVPAVNNRTAQILFECATTSPLPDALMAANHLLKSLSANATGGLTASRDLDEKTSEALIWSQLDSKNERVKESSIVDAGKLDVNKPGFLESYSATRLTEFSSPEAELAWFDFAQLCVAYRTRRAIPKALRAGSYFTDQIDSPAESLLIARCAELGFAIPYLQVNILDPVSGRHLGRVDGLWPSSKVLKGLYLKDSSFGRFLFIKQRGDSESIVIEFDGRMKYQQDYFETLDKERIRQNSIGNLGFRFVRIGWSDLMQPEQLHSILAEAKVPRSRRNSRRSLNHS